DGRALVDNMPVDPLGASIPCESELMEDFWLNLIAVFERQGWYGTGFQTAGDMGLRILFRLDGGKPEADPQQDPRLARPCLHDHAIPLTGAVDELAAEGLYLLAIGCAPLGPEGALQPCIELPAFPDVASFQVFLRQVAEAAARAGLRQLVWRGFPPPVDDSVAWTTLTPDPAVVEINAAPAADVRQFLDMSRTLYTVAEAEGLSPYRLHYNGKLSDSGGGGQFTLGGASPAHSPFFVYPQLAPRLIRYLNQHPALSYWFAPSYVGSFSQSPRPDENVRESFSELSVALQQLAKMADPQPEFIWRALSPFLVDTSGNAHRSELNIEKLWNPYLPARGCLGLVEFRAFRMMRDPQSAASVAALLRAIVALLCRQDVATELTDWGQQLHERFALPFYLRQDLDQVLTDLESVGLGLGEPITRCLCDDSARHIGHAEIGNCRLEVDQAVEFWPLLGDAASQEGDSSRLVDASTTRLQLSLRPADGNRVDLDGWQLLAGAYRVPLRDEPDERGALRVTGLRYRSFVPWTGLHPGIGAQAPLVLTLLPPAGSGGLRITLHEWQPQGAPYQGLPATFEEASKRRAERFVVEELLLDPAAEILPPPAEALSDYCLDLRCS
ncbi:MAG: transglutaminase family protein, partial [Pseudomonadota bacterium]|nr:transglutaminase family protein [Pseudomonadota bacterium]